MVECSAPLAASLIALAARADALPAAAAERLAAAADLARAALAVAELSALLDRTGRRSRWALAVEIKERLDRFEDTAWPRIRDGHRQPRDLLETLLTTIMLAPGPRSAKRLHPLL